MFSMVLMLVFDLFANGDALFDYLLTLDFPTAGVSSIIELSPLIFESLSLWLLLFANYNLTSSSVMFFKVRLFLECYEFDDFTLLIAVSCL